MSPRKVRRHLDEKLKNRIAGLRQSNLTYKRIFEILKKEKVETSLSAVKRIGQRFEIQGTVSRKVGSGRPRASTMKDDHRLKMTVLKDRKKTLVDHSKQFETAKGNSLSRVTISRRMKEMGFSSKRCAKKPLLTKKNISDRKTFASRYGTKDADWFRNVFWSDESRFCLASDAPERCIRRSGERFSPNCIKTTVKHGNGGIMVWGTFTAAGVGEIIRCDASINAKEYIQILERGLLPSIQKLEMNNNIIFQHDNAPAHTAKVTKKWLTDNSIDMMFWPGQSPDLNPIENIWAIISRALARKTFSNKEKLWEAVQIEWNNISSSQCAKLVESMIKRIDLLKKSKGNSIPY